MIWLLLTLLAFGLLSMTSMHVHPGEEAQQVDLTLGRSDQPPATNFSLVSCLLVGGNIHQPARIGVIQHVLIIYFRVVATYNLSCFTIAKPPRDGAGEESKIFKVV